MADVGYPRCPEADAVPTSSSELKLRSRLRHYEPMLPNWSHLSLRLQELAQPRRTQNYYLRPEEFPRTPPFISREERKKWLEHLATPRCRRAPSPAPATKWRNDSKLSNSQLGALIDRLKPKNAVPLRSLKHSASLRTLP